MEAGPKNDARNSGRGRSELHGNCDTEGARRTEIDYEELDEFLLSVEHDVVDEWCAWSRKGVALYPVSALTIPDMDEMLTPIRKGLFLYNAPMPEFFEELKRRKYQRFQQIVDVFPQ